MTDDWTPDPRRRQRPEGARRPDPARPPRNVDPEAPRPRRRPPQPPQPRRPPAEPGRTAEPDVDPRVRGTRRQTPPSRTRTYDDGYDTPHGYDDPQGYDDPYAYDDGYDVEADWDHVGRGRGVMLLLGLVVVALICVGGYAILGDQLRDFIGNNAPDYDGDGNGTEVLITIVEGDTGADVASTLNDEGVTKSFQAFYDLLLGPHSDLTFQPGVYSLEEEMSAQAALDAFRDPTTRVTNRLVVREGLSAHDAFVLVSDATGIPVAEFESAAADPAALGLPAEATTIEGFLFPATYELEPDATATSVVQMMVDEMISRLDAAGIPAEDRYEVVTLASIIQREAGSVDEDFYKVSRVFHNRLDAGQRLESDATVAYGRGHYDSVFTTDEERADASNPYNTYANPGLPVGPIGLPGELAIDAAANPVDGPWFFFVTVNLKTGETKFSENLADHNAAVQELRSWCRASEENASYCE